MKGLVFLSGEAPDIALAEVNGALRALGKRQTAKSVDAQIAVLEQEPPEGLAKRLGFTHFTGTLQQIRTLKMEDILAGVVSILNGIDDDRAISFQVKAPKGTTSFSSSELFYALDALARRSGFLVKHREPDIRLFVIIRSRAYIGKILETSERTLAENRRGSKMPYNRPIIMDPRLARVMVNLSELPAGSRVLDPFIGPAGLAIEAAHLGIDVIGVEKEPEIFHGARVNVEHLELSERITIKNGDSRKLRSYPWIKDLGKIDGVITDPPFGRSATTGGEEPGELVNKVLGEISDILPKGAPLVLDSHSPELIQNIPGYELKDVFSFRVHKSMTRHIALLLKL